MTMVPMLIVLTVLAGEPEPLQVGAARLGWDAPPGCPGAEQVGVQLGELLPEAGASGPVRIDATARVQPVDGGFELRLETRSPSGATVQRLTASRCETLAEAGVLIVALAVDPMAAVRQVQAAEAGPLRPTPERGGPTGGVPSLEPLVPPPTLPAEPPVNAARPQPEPSGRPMGDVFDPAAEAADPPAQPTIRSGAPDPAGNGMPVRLGLRLTGGGSVGVLPAATGAVGGAFAVFDRRWRAETLWMFDVPVQARAAGGITADVGLWWGSLRGCGVPGVSDWSFPLCGGLEAGALRGRGAGTTVEPRTDREPWLAAHGGPAVAWAPFRSLALVAQVDLVVPILRGGFRVGETPVYEVGAVAGRFQLGLEFRTL